jgi:ABC-2 type transport system permease protein/sodium transport system permease protein
MPMLLYPVVGIAFRQFFLSNLAAAAAPEYRLAISSEPEYRLVEFILQVGQQSLAGPAAAAGPPDEAEPPAYRFIPVLDLDLAVRESQADLGIRVPDAERAERDAGRGLNVTWELLYREDSVLGMNALAFVESRCAAANARVLEERLRRLGAVRPERPVRAVRAPLRDAGLRSSVSFAAIVPLVLILMTITGAVYPAIDLTAGERERGTLEVLVAAPVPRTGLLFAKYVAVVVVAVLTALVNLVAMTLTVRLSGIGPKLFGDTGLTPGTVAAVFGLLLLFAAFFAAVLLILTSFARSFKEAQAYLIPLMLVALVPGMLGLTGLPLSAPLAVLPLINIVLLARDLFEHSADAGLAALVVGSTLVYALAAIFVAGRIFGAEAVLYGEGGGWPALFRRRKPAPLPPA